MSKNSVRDIVKNLMQEVRKVELINYKVASDKYFIFWEIDHFNYETVQKLREDEDLEDFGYFSAIRDLFTEYIYNDDIDDIDNTEKVLNIIREFPDPYGSMDYYGDYYYLTIVNDILSQAILLNNTLAKNERVIEVEQEIQRIQVKKNITVSEFAAIYNISKTSQQNYRGRLHDPLPYHQKVEGGKIVYVVEEVEKWFDNQYK